MKIRILKLSKILLVGLVMMITLSCNKEEIDLTKLSGTDNLVFGTFYGECIGETCVRTYKLTSTKLYVDSKKEYGGGSFDFLEMGDEKFEVTKDLIEFFPEKLYDEENQTFGCPDCVDQGGIRIRYTRGNLVKEWIIDTDKGAVPEYMHEFIDKVEETIGLIK